MPISVHQRARGGGGASRAWEHPPGREEEVGGAPGLYIYIYIYMGGGCRHDLDNKMAEHDSLQARQKKSLKLARFCVQTFSKLGTKKALEWQC